MNIANSGGRTSYLEIKNNLINSFEEIRNIYIEDEICTLIQYSIQSYYEISIRSHGANDANALLIYDYLKTILSYCYMHNRDCMNIRIR
jgi:hypothetical protein